MSHSLVLSESTGFRPLLGVSLNPSESLLCLGMPMLEGSVNKQLQGDFLW
jgi:hypothetical protein